MERLNKVALQEDRKLSSVFAWKYQLGPRVLLNTIIVMFAVLFHSHVKAVSDDGWNQWPVVGQAQLSWFLFDVYESQLKTPSGSYQVSPDITPHPAALAISYQRSISKKQLLNATLEQWEKLGIEELSRNSWLNDLENIFPSVVNGDQLIYVTDGVKGDFYFDAKGEREMQHLGSIQDEALNDAFLAIWLSPDTEYPKLRNQLIGMNR